MANLNSLISFIPTEEKDEITDLIAYLLNERIINDSVEELAYLDPATLNQAWGSTPPNDVYDEMRTDVVLNRAQPIFGNLNVSDLLNPKSKYEEKLVNQLWDELLSFYTGDRARFIKSLINDYVERYEFSTNNHPFEEFSGLGITAFRNIITEPVQESLANYYIGLAQRYIRFHRVKFTHYIKVEDSNGNPIRNARLAVLDGSGGNETGVVLYSNHEGLARNEFSTFEDVDSTYRNTYYVHVSLDGLVADEYSVAYDHNAPDQISTVQLSDSDHDSSTLGSITGTIPTALRNYIQNKLSIGNANNALLKDIREIGLIRNQDDYSLSGSADTYAKKIDALSVYELVKSGSSSLSLHESIYGNFESPIQVASTSRKQFLENHDGLFSDRYEALVYHETCVKQSMYAASRMGQTRDGLNPSLVENPEIPDINQDDDCGCNDCESAVGPQAYLADLLNFCASHVVIDDGSSVVPVDANWIDTNLHQDLDEIPASCDALEDTYCQGRLATQVLVKMANNPGDTSLDKRRVEYIEESYRSILQGLGTSYEDLQSIQTASEGDRRDYAHNLGIVFEYADENSNPQETVKVMYKDLSSLTVDDELALLYRYFGLPSTDASATLPGNQEGNWLTKWKRFRLRELWMERDFPSNAYYKKERAVLDPDIVTVDDFRNPTIFSPSAGKPRAYELWEHRWSYLNTATSNLKTTIGSDITLGFSDLEGNGNYEYSPISGSNSLSGTVWPSNSQTALESIYNGGDSSQLFTTYGLKMPELKRLYDLIELAFLSDDEISEAVNIFIRAVKRKLSELETSGTIPWVEEEDTLNVELSAKEFIIAQNRPKEGQWPEKDLNTPILDPDLVSEKGLPEIIFRETSDVNAKNYLNANANDLNSYLESTLKGTSLTLEGKVDDAFSETGYTLNGSAPKLVDLLNDLDDPQESDNAIDTIENILKLSVDDFVFLVSTVSAGNELSSTEEELIWSILLYVRKIHSFYSVWAGSESAKPVWKLVKAKLPLWRAYSEERQEWEKALTKNNEAPIIDPDLIGPAYLKKPYENEPAFDLWQQRFSLVHGSSGIYDDISNTDVNQSTTVFDNFIKKYLFENAEISLLDLIELRDNKIDVTPFFDQLQCTASDFKYFENCREIIVGQNTLTADQKDRLYYRLTAIQKKRLYYSWKVEEENSNIAQSPDFFRNRDEDYFTYPPTLPYELNTYLASSNDLNLWRRTIVSREDEEEGLLVRINELLANSDDENIEYIRNAYIYFLETGNLSLTEKARKLGDKLFINLEDNCCSKTNATAFAIETLQQIIWKTNTGDALSEYPDIKLELDSFDSVWKWMGSYGNWRSSMFVFLYPENLLLPSLKQKSSPGFRELLNETSNNRRLNPGGVCNLAEDFSNYINDVNTLELKCSIQAEVLAKKEDKCADQAQILEDQVFVFATAKNSGKTYYSTAISDDQGFEQKLLWKDIPQLSNDAILKGCDVYKSDKHKVNFLYLFYLKTSVTSVDRFYALRFDLDKNRWEESHLEFELSEDEFSFTIDTTQDSENIPSQLLDNLDLNIVALEVCKNQFIWQAPSVAISLKSSYTDQSEDDDIPLIITFTRRLNSEGEEFRDEFNWDLWHSFIDLYDLGGQSFSNPRSMIGSVHSYAFRQNGNPDPYWHGAEYYFVFSEGYNNDDLDLNILRLSRNYQGELRSTSDSLNATPTTIRNTYLFPYSKEGEMEILTCTPLTDNNWLISSQFGEEDTENFVVKIDAKFTFTNASPSISDQEMPFVHVGENNSILLRKIKYTISTDKFELSDNFLELTPQFNEAPALDPDLNKQGRLALKATIVDSFLQTNVGNNPVLRIFLSEAYFFVPLEFALSLTRNGFYSEALQWFRLVYDFYAPLSERKIYIGLEEEESLDELSDRISDWYEDPFNPHAIAATRQNAYTRFVIISIANCLYKYANSEFTSDNSESVPRARELYEDIQELLSILKPSDPCQKEETLRPLESYIDDDVNWRYLWNDLLRQITEAPLTKSKFTEIVEGGQGEDSIETLLTGFSGLTEIQKSEKYKEVEERLTNALDVTPDGIVTKIASANDLLFRKQGALMAEKDERVYLSGESSTRCAITRSLTSVTGFDTAELKTENLDWLTDDSNSNQSSTRTSSPMTYGKSESVKKFTISNARDAMVLANPFDEVRISGLPFLFCVVPNPIVAGLRMAAEANLYKIHNCMNIAGMVRELSPFAAPTDATSGIPSIGVGGTLQQPGQISVAPSNFRYSFLIDRARQLASLAQQMEGSLLQYLERFDAETFSQLKADQDIELAKGNIKLQDLKVKEAESNKKLAELQKERAEIQVNGLQSMIDDGLLSSEQRLITLYNHQFIISSLIEAFRLASDISSIFINANSSMGPAKIASLTSFGVYAATRTYSTVLTVGLNSINRDISIQSLYASLQRRQQEWNYQKSIAQQDVKIGSQQIKIANDRIRIASQEREIADLQLNHAEATLDFLKNKFTSAALYEWMSGVLEDVYAYFLQEATAMAKMAEQQLAFERQINLPSLIKSDYWSVNSNSLVSAGGNNDNSDRKGLTGSARLTKDLAELDQYAFDSTERKLQMTKVISLNEYDPVQMEIFRNTGRYLFNSSAEQFDNDYPGHYLRLIKRVSVTVIALVPPNKGIKATLINNGISKVVTGDIIFQTRTIARNPERIAISSPYNDYGVFQLQQETNQYLPFEGTGVETSWEFTMEKASNPFDYRSIADVLISIEYEAKHSTIYERLVKGRLNADFPSANIVLSLRNDLPDTWYELINGIDNANGFESNFEIRDTDLTPHGLNPSINTCKVFLSHSIEEGDETLNDSNLQLTQDPDGENTVSGNEISLVNFVSNPAIEADDDSFNEASPVGNWNIHITNSIQVRNMIAENKLNDILIVFSYNIDNIPFTS